MLLVFAPGYTTQQTPSIRTVVVFRGAVLKTEWKAILYHQEIENVYAGQDDDDDVKLPRPTTKYMPFSRRPQQYKGTIPGQNLGERNECTSPAKLSNKRESLVSS